MLSADDNTSPNEQVAMLLPASLINQIASVVEQRVTARAIHSPAPPSPYMTVAETATYLRASKQRVYDLLSSGRLPRHKDGSRVLIARADVDRHLLGIGGAA